MSTCADLKAEADRLRAQGIDVGIVFELQGEMRLLDVYDPGRQPNSAGTGALRRESGARPNRRS